MGDVCPVGVLPPLKLKRLHTLTVKICFIST